MTPDTEQHHTSGRAAGAWATTPERAPGSRPSPRPRPRTAPPAAPGPVPDDVTPHGVTQSEVSNLSTGESESAPGPGPVEVDGVEVSTLQSSLQSRTDTLRERIRSGWAGVREYLTPPSVLTEPPASVAELAAYVHWGTWTSSTGGPLRKLGIVWHRLISLPITVVCRYVEWIAQRPGRALPVYLLWKLLISTGPGPWVADHIIRPVLGALAWVLL
jgi:hypothetical protein